MSTRLCSRHCSCVAVPDPRLLLAGAGGEALSCTLEDRTPELLPLLLPLVQPG